jgi:hypothetical protein
MRPAVVGAYLNFLLLSQRAIIALMKLCVFLIIVGWAAMGVALSMWLLPPPILRSIP